MGPTLLASGQRVLLRNPWQQINNSANDVLPRTLCWCCESVRRRWRNSGSLRHGLVLYRRSATQLCAGGRLLVSPPGLSRTCKNGASEPTQIRSPLHFTYKLKPDLLFFVYRRSLGFWILIWLRFRWDLGRAMGSRIWSVLWRDISSSGIMIDPAAEGSVSPSLSCIVFF